MLVELLGELRGPLSADMRRFYNCNLTEALRGEVAPLQDIAAWAAHLPPESAVFRAQHPDGRWQHTHALELQRAQVYATQNVAFTVAKVTKHKMQEPEPILFPWEETDDGSIKGDSMDVDAADDWLGWSEEMKQQLML